MSSPWIVALRQLRAVLFKEIQQTLADRRVLFLLVVAPMVQLLMFGFAVDFAVDDVPAVVVDEDGEPEGRRLLAALFADGTLRRVADVADVGEAAAWMDRGEAAAAVIVPAGFAQDLAHRQPATVQVLVDGTDPSRSGVAASAAGQFFGREGLDRMADRLAAMGLARASVHIQPRLLFNPELRSPVYMVPGIAGMLLFIVTTIVTAMGLAREGELGTLEQVRVTPIPSAVLLLGKVLPFIVVGLFDVTVAITLGVVVFDVPIRGSLALFYLATAVYLLTTVGVGLFIATVSQTQQQAFLGGFMFILPAMLLSGTLTPIHAMPAWLQPVTAFNPLRYYMEVVRSVLLKGAGLVEVHEPLLKLLLMGVVVMAVAVRRFRRTVA